MVGWFLEEVRAGLLVLGDVLRHVLRVLRHLLQELPQLPVTKSKRATKSTSVCSRVPALFNTVPNRLILTELAQPELHQQQHPTQKRMLSVCRTLEYERKEHVFVRYLHVVGQVSRAALDGGAGRLHVDPEEVAQEGLLEVAVDVLVVDDPEQLVDRHDRLTHRLDEPTTEPC